MLAIATISLMLAGLLKAIEYFRAHYWSIKNWWMKRTNFNQLELKVVKGQYPANMRYLDEKNKVMIVEAMAGKRMVLVDGKPVCLYFPYTYFIIPYITSQSNPHEINYLARTFWVGFSSERLYNTTGKVGRIPLSNYNSPSPCRC